MVLLVRYGELALKSRYVRRQLEDRLVSNIQDMFAANDVECVVRKERGRVYVHADDEAAAIRLLRRVFGIVSISAAKEASSDLEALTREVVDYARGVLSSGMAFAIRPRRSGQHPYTSQDLGRVLGQAVRDSIPGLAVNLDAPDREIHVEVRGARACVFHEVVAGPGGLPLGSQGEVLAVVEDEAGMVAVWMMMRRGCRVRVAGGEPLLDALRRWDPRLETMDEDAGTALLQVTKRSEMPIVLSRLDGLAGDVVEAGPLALQPLAGIAEDEIRLLLRTVKNQQSHEGESTP